METSVVKRTLTLALLCTVAGGAWGRCCFPSQYSANQATLKSTVRGAHLSLMFANNFYWYDAIREMEKSLEYVTVDGNQTRVTVIKDYNVTKTKYVISADGHCSRTPVDAFKRGCVPDWATKLVSSHYANSTSGMPIDVYNNTAGGATSFLVTAPDGCYPILDVSVVPIGPSPYMQVDQFYNFTLGIQDPSVFNIPDSCKDPVVIGQ